MLAKDRKSERALHACEKTDPGWGIRRGDKVLNVRWMGRVKPESDPLVFKAGGMQKTLLKTVLPLRVSWGRTTTTRYYSGANQHADFGVLCDKVREIR